MTTLTIIGKDGCHLCDVADEIVQNVVADLPTDIADGIDIAHASISEDPALYDAWWEKIPVVLIDGQVHAHWRVSADRLRSALVSAGREGIPA